MATIHPMAKSLEIYKENTFLLYGNMKCLALMIATSSYCRYAVVGPGKKTGSRSLKKSRALPIVIHDLVDGLTHMIKDSSLVQKWWGTHR
jgi:hypothetical protein